MATKSKPKLKEKPKLQLKGIKAPDTESRPDARVGNILGLPQKEIDPKYKDLLDAIAMVDPTQLINRRMFSPYNPEILVQRKGLGIYDKMCRDEQIKACLKFKKDALMASGWEVVSPGERPDDWEVTRFVKDVFSMHIQGGFKKTMNKILRAFEYGYSVTEKVYAEIEEGEWSGKVGLREMISLKPHYIDMVTDIHGRVTAILQRNVAVTNMDGPTSSRDPMYPPAKFVRYTYQEAFENPYGTSDLVAAYRPWWTKDNAYKFLAVYLERFGMAPFIMSYNSSVYTGNMLDELKKFIKNIQNGTFGLIPRLSPTDIDLKNDEISTSSKDIFIGALEKFDKDISRALLVPSLIGMSSDDTVGSLARAETHFDSFLLTVIDLQDDVASNAINSQIIKQLCDLNFPGLDEYPVFRFLPFKDQKRIDMFRLWMELVTGKVVNRIPDDETHIRRSLGFPENEAPKLEPLPKDAELDIKKKEAMKPAPKPMTRPAAKKKFDEDEETDWFVYDEEDFDTDGEVVLEEDQSAEEQEFSRTSGCVWKTINGKKVCIKPKANANERARRALNTYKPMDKKKSDVARMGEEKVLMMTRTTKTSDQDAFDTYVKVGRKLHAVEVKTMTDQVNSKITMHPGALRRKLSTAKRLGAVAHTVIVDSRPPSLNSGHDVYYMRGVGSFRVPGRLIRVQSSDHLKQLMTTNLGITGGM
jgi:hypothetical protein